MPKSSLSLLSFLKIFFSPGGSLSLQKSFVRKLYLWLMFSLLYKSTFPQNILLVIADVQWRANWKPYIFQPILHLDHSCLSALHRNFGSLKYIKYSEKFKTIISFFPLKTEKNVCVICRVGMKSFRGTNRWRKRPTTRL